MKQERQQFDRAFKVMAVELCLSGKPTGEVAQELGIRANLLSRWKREYKQRKDGSFSGHGQTVLEFRTGRGCQVEKAITGGRN